MKIPMFLTATVLAATAIPNCPGGVTPTEPPTPTPWAATPTEAPTPAIPAEIRDGAWAVYDYQYANDGCGVLPEPNAIVGMQMDVATYYVPPRELKLLDFKQNNLRAYTRQDYGPLEGAQEIWTRTYDDGRLQCRGAAIVTLDAYPYDDATARVDLNYAVSWVGGDACAELLDSCTTRARFYVTRTEGQDPAAPTPTF